MKGYEWHVKLVQRNKDIIMYSEIAKVEIYDIKDTKWQLMWFLDKLIRNKMEGKIVKIVKMTNLTNIDIIKACFRCEISKMKGLIVMSS